MKKKYPISIIIILRQILIGIILFVIPVSLWSVPLKSKPNIILIMADDLGYAGLGANGGTTFKTPYLDDMAAKGVRFTNCYTTPTCTPSRVNLISGQHPHNNGWIEGIWHKKGFPPVDWTTVPSFGSMLKSAGYKTSVSGKWQLCVFDQDPNHAVEAGFDEYFLWSYKYEGESHSRYYAPWIWENGAIHEEYTNDTTAYGPDLHNDFVLDFIERQKDTTFFIYYPMILIHYPRHRPPGYTSHPFRDMVNYMDVLVEKVRQKVHDAGIAENTLILFTSDNGFEGGMSSTLGDLKIKGRKHTVCNVATHVPLIAYWSGRIPENKVVTDMIEFADFLPTLYSFGGGSLFPGAKVDGRSFANQILSGENTGGPDFSFALAEKEEQLITDGHYTLYNDGRFYDIEADYTETTEIPEGTGSSEAEAARAALKVKLDNIDEDFVEFPPPNSEILSILPHGSGKAPNTFYYLQNGMEIKAKPNSEIYIFDLTGTLRFQGMTDNQGILSISSGSNPIPEGIYITKVK